MTKNVYFVSGIDTEIGKTYATGYLARKYTAEGQRVITQKLIQTGNHEVSEDIEKHRQIMGVNFFPEDHERLTMPEIFSYPASPHLAAQIDQRDINFTAICNATETLAQRFDMVLLEGAGGLMVPLTQTYLTIDYIKEHQFPVILVTSGRLGSINHTLLSLHALKAYEIDLYAIAYNLNDDTQDQTIAEDTKIYLQAQMLSHFPKAQWISIPKQ